MAFALVSQYFHFGSHIDIYIMINLTLLVQDDDASLQLHANCVSAFPFAVFSSNVMPFNWEPQRLPTGQSSFWRLRALR